MLAVTVTKPMIAQLAASADWAFTQKLDGKRALAVVDSAQRPRVQMHGRSGQQIKIPATVGRQLERLPEGRYILDGELMKNDVYYLFDAPQISPKNQPLIGLTNPYRERMEVLRHLARQLWTGSHHIQVLPVAATPETKLKLFRGLQECRAEGIVARRMDAPYRDGQRSPFMAKLKFIKTADCVIDRESDEGKNSYVLIVYDEQGNKVPVGMVSRQVGDARHAHVGDVLEVEYLTFSSHGRMVQPTNPKLRLDKLDKLPRECLLDQFFPMDMKQIMAYIDLDEPAASQCPIH